MSEGGLVNAMLRWLEANLPSDDLSPLLDQELPGLPPVCRLEVLRILSREGHREALRYLGPFRTAADPVERLWVAGILARLGELEGLDMLEVACQNAVGGEQSHLPLVSEIYAALAGLPGRRAAVLRSRIRGLLWLPEPMDDETLLACLRYMTDQPTWADVESLESAGVTQSLSPEAGSVLARLPSRARAAALLALCRGGCVGVAEHLGNLAEETDPELRAAAAELLVAAGQPEGFQILKEAIDAHRRGASLGAIPITRVEDALYGVEDPEATRLCEEARAVRQA
jgi:hypothetical protein